MTTTVAVLLEATFATATGVGYTSANAITVLDKVTCTNESAAIAVATVQLISPDGASVQSQSKSIAPGASWSFPDVVGHVLAINGKVNVLSPVANAIKPRISGRKFT